MSLLFTHLLHSLRRPDHWVYGSWLDTVVKYRKTRLGIVWLLIPTVVYIWGIGGFLAALQPGVSGPNFLAHVGMGFLVFRFFSTVLIDATSVFANSQSYIYDGHVRLTDFVLRSVARSFYYFLLSLPVVAIAVLASPQFDPAGLAPSIAGMAVVVLNLFLYGVLFSIAGARFPDLHELMGSAIMALFLITPIVWYSSAASAETLHGQLMRLNPLYHLLAVVRGPLLQEAVEPTTYAYLGGLTLVGVLLASVVYGAKARRVPVWL
ncbi:hypothetical protein [Lysobacter sp. Root690]|uniref:ABC transporter permease n=1 Tax=Lysobacter sp. Root690 TaxID=1736588 RepID=UPI0006F85C40|nr:hypothetical protein [Lysobacter sp. Root690]KRB06196.1 hypothetical protein ASD86_15600 [Lysobacter sp. Root690]